MHTWAPLFSKIVESSLWAEPDHVVKVFLTMMAKQDSDHVVRASAYQIGEWSKKGEAVALDALRILSSPDTKRLEPQEYEGRRIERVEEGWLILNGQIYEDLMRKMNRKMYKARKERERRERIIKERGKPLGGEVAHGKAMEAGASREQLDRILWEPGEKMDEAKRKREEEESQISDLKSQIKRAGCKYPAAQPATGGSEQSSKWFVSKIPGV